MVAFPNCKINLGLNILKKRDDGYHDIETVFFPLPLFDVLEIVTSASGSQLDTTGILAGEMESNLTWKAYRLLKKDYPQLPEIKMHLHKTIPVGAGLGGGSADAAFTLSLLNKKYALHIPDSALFNYALQLGSDCPFFLLNKPCIANGRGEKMTPIDVSLLPCKILLVNPGIHISTKELFQQIKPSVPTREISEIIQQPVATWKNDLVNDFEQIVFQQHGEIETIKEKLYEHHAVYASMTGTGSTVFGIFRKDEVVDITFPEHYFKIWIHELV